MKVKHFCIRLNKENLQADQDALNNFIENVVVKKSVTELINGEPNFWSILIFYDQLKEIQNITKSEKFAITTESELTDEEKNIYRILKIWRNDKANELNIPNYVVAQNSELMSVAKIKPQSLEELSKIKGFATGGQRITKYGDDIIAVLNSI